LQSLCQLFAEIVFSLSPVSNVNSTNPNPSANLGNLPKCQRRLEACKRLGWTKITAHEVETLSDARDRLIAERDENTCREDMKPSEKVTLGKALEALKPARPVGRPPGNSVKFTEFPKGPVTREIVGEAVGMSGVTYQRAKAIVEASEDESLPDDVRAVAVEAREKMDRTGKVSGVYNVVRRAVHGNPVSKPTTNGRARPRRIGPGAEKRRMEDFMRAYGVLIQACTTAPTVDVPPLPSERRAELCAELERAVRCVHQLKHKIEEAT
jgi:hypothetical protein